MIPQVSPAKRDVVKVAVEVKGVTQLYEMDQVSLYFPLFDFCFNNLIILMEESHLYCE